MSNIRRRLRGIVGNAVVWGIGWGLLGFVTTFALGLTGVIERVWWLDAVGMGIRIGVVGGIAGAAFSAFIALAYRGRRIQDISPLRFGIGGALVSAVGLPLFMQTMNVLSGDGPVPWQHIRGDVLMLAAFGGVAAAFSLKLAQVAARRAPDIEVGPLGEPERADLLPAGGGEIPVRQRTRSDAATS